MGLQVGLSLIEKNKIEQKAMTCLACRGCGESCPEEALKERGEGEGPPSRLSKVMSRASQSEAEASDPKRREALENTDPAPLPWGPGRLAWSCRGAWVPGFSRLVSEESGGRWGLFTSDRPAWPHLSQSVKHPSTTLQKHSSTAAFMGCDQQSQTLFSTSTNRCLKLGRNL